MEKRPSWVGNGAKHCVCLATQPNTSKSKRSLFVLYQNWYDHSFGIIRDLIVILIQYVHWYLITQLLLKNSNNSKAVITMWKTQKCQWTPKIHILMPMKVDFLLVWFFLVSTTSVIKMTIYAHLVQNPPCMNSAANTTGVIDMANLDKSGVAPLWWLWEQLLNY